MLERVAAHLEAYLRSTGITPAATIQTALGISQPTLSRAVAALGPVVIRIGRARATHYAHVFYPLTGLTAEKHDSFLDPVGDGTAFASFTGKNPASTSSGNSSAPSCSATSRSNSALSASRVASSSAVSGTGSPWRRRRP
mgnify:CR=1 FL=1